MNTFSYQAPGSVMLLGEHAVLHGFPAVVCAVDRFMHASLMPRSDNEIHISSDRFGKFITSLDALSIEKPFQFVLAAIMQYQQQFSHGFDLEITSEFSDKVGLGSSSAVVVATLGVLQKWLFKVSNKEALFEKGLNVIHQIQGIGSGADVAACVYGGVVHYQIDPLKIEEMENIFPISLVYAGYKTSTVEVIKKVRALEKKNPEIYAELYQQIGDCVLQGIKAIESNDLEKLGKVFYEHQQLQVQLGVSDAVLEMIIDQCNQLSTVYGAKISGSGLGDCVVVLGSLPKDYFPMSVMQKDQGILQIDVKIMK